MGPKTNTGFTDSLPLRGPEEIRDLRAKEPVGGPRLSSREWCPRLPAGRPAQGPFQGGPVTHNLP